MKSLLSITLGAFALLSFTPRTTAQLEVQIVNDTGTPDADLHLLLTGKPFTGGVANSPIVSPANVLLNLDNPSNPDSTAFISLATLPKASVPTITSHFTGAERSVYNVTVTSVGSGGFYFSEGPMSYGPAPTVNDTTTRFDLMELSYNQGKDSVADTTSIDAFGIPILIELIGSEGEVEDQQAVYANTQSWIDACRALGLGDAVLGRKKVEGSAPDAYELVQGWTTTEDFVRIIGPTKIGALNGNENDVSPYPSFKSYLQSLLDANYTFLINGQGNGSNYIDYQGSIVSDGSGGYQILLTPPSPLNGGGIFPAPTTPAGNVPPSNATVTIYFPADKINVNTYGAPLSTASFSISDYTITDTNIVYGAMVRDVLSGLNFGFLDGAYGDDGEIWYSKIDLALPFGNAREVNDGFYNTWAAVIYDFSDAYGFAFSDRNVPEPTVDLYDNATLRITLLPDDRMDSPTVTTKAITDTSITLQWPAVEGASGYDILVTSPLPGQTISVPAVSGALSYTQTIDGLEAGTPYTIAVRATATAANSNPLYTPARERVVTTSNTPTYAPGDQAVPFQISFNSADTLNIPPTSGTFKLIDPATSELPAQTTASINYNATASELETTIEASLTNHYSNVVVTGNPGGPWTVTQANNGAVAGSFQFDSSALLPKSGVAVTLTNGGSGSSKQVQNIRLGQYLLESVEINGIELVHGSSGQWGTPSTATIPGIPARVTAKYGSNNYLVKVKDTLGNETFYNMLNVVVSQDGANAKVDSASLSGAVPLSVPAGSFPISDPVTFTLGITFSPTGERVDSEIKLPGTGDTFNQWLKNSYPEVAPHSPVENPDGDNILSIFEYFFGFNPGIWVSVQDEGFTVDDFGDELHMQYRQSKNLSGIYTEAQWSTDLQDWSDEGVTYLPDQDMGDYILRTAVIPKGANTNIFVRLLLLHHS